MYLKKYLYVISINFKNIFKLQFYLKNIFLVKLNFGMTLKS